MAVITLKKNDEIMMSLVHYFVTKENYAPINVKGVTDEIWLQNLEGPYRVIRISCNSIINEEQYNFDIFKVRHVLKQIKKKTLSFKMNALNIYLDLDMDLNNANKNIDSIKINDINDVKKNDELLGAFPYIKDELIEKNDSLDLIVNVTNDINEKTEKENKRYSKVFTPKKIVLTNVVIGICLVMFIAMYLFGHGSTDVETLLKFGANYGPYVVIKKEVWRLLTCAFLHIGIFHLIVNMYSLYVIGAQVENFLGKAKFLVIYLLSAIGGSLMSICFHTTISAGASGAIFGLMGSLLYFGYHYRLYLGDAIKNQIIPIIFLNLLIGFTSSGIDNAAHIGGLITGYLATMAVGITDKSTKKDMINGSIVLVLYFIFLFLVIFRFKRFL